MVHASVWQVSHRTMLEETPLRSGRASFQIWVFSGSSSSSNNIIERQTGHESETVVLYCSLKVMVPMTFGFVWVLVRRRERRRA